MAVEKHPCESGLTPECFEKYPAWAKQAFAYKLIHTLLPPWLTRRLPKWLRLALIGEGAILPPGFIPPDGSIIPPGYTFPPGWTPGDPVPPGITIPPGTTFPPGWTAGDPVPAGVTLEPGATFPPGWTAGDPLPDSFGPTPPPGIIVPPGGVVPATYMDPNDPGPRHRPRRQPPAPARPDSFTAENDGQINQRQTTWSTAHDATVGLYMQKTDPVSNLAIQARTEFIYRSIKRTFLEFDLSSIPVGTKITEGLINIHGYGYANCNGSIQEGNQSDNLALEDYDAFTGSPFDTIAFTTDSMTFTLNAAGRAYIESQFGSKAKFCIREQDHDVLNIQPGMDQNFGAGMYYSEAIDPDKRPTLAVTYE